MAPVIATEYFTVSITALEGECHKIWLVPPNICKHELTLKKHT